MKGYESEPVIRSIMYANPSLTNKTTDRQEDEFIYSNMVGCNPACYIPKLAQLHTYI
jgi:hypothetical protein